MNRWLFHFHLKPGSDSGVLSAREEKSLDNCLPCVLIVSQVVLENWKKRGAEQDLMSAWRMMGTGPFLALYASIYVLSLMWAATGSMEQSNWSHRRTWGDDHKSCKVAAFWISLSWSDGPQVVVVQPRDDKGLKKYMNGPCREEKLVPPDVMKRKPAWLSVLSNMSEECLLVVQKHTKVLCIVRWHDSNVL